MLAVDEISSKPLICKGIKKRELCSVLWVLGIIMASGLQTILRCRKFYGPPFVYIYPVTAKPSCMILMSKISYLLALCSKSHMCLI